MERIKDIKQMSNNRYLNFYEQPTSYKIYRLGKKFHHMIPSKIMPSSECL